MPAPSALYATAALRTLERRARTQAGIAEDTLIRRAGQAGWRCLLRHWPEAQRILVHIFSYHYREVAAQRRCLEDVDACVHLGDGGLGGRGILLLDDPLDRAVGGADNAPVSGRIGQNGRQERRRRP